ncbi:MAG: cupin domain-containing protein [Nitrososphaerota archaeon]|nr:cupin domain-containing protein [Nitrososphaerota archaeon]
MAKIIRQDKIEYFLSKVPGRRRTFLVGKEICNSTHLKADTVRYSPGAEGGEHYHKSESFIYIMEGECDVRINGISSHVSAGTMVYLDPGDRHYIKNTGSIGMVMLEAFAPQKDSASIWTDPSAPHEWIKHEAPK